MFCRHTEGAVVNVILICSITNYGHDLCPESACHCIDSSSTRAFGGEKLVVKLKK